MHVSIVHACRLLLLTLLAGVLASCSGASAVAPVPTAQLQAPINLFLWHGWGGAQARTLTLLVDSYNRSQGAVRVVPQRAPLSTMIDDLHSASAAGSGPHLLLLPSRWVGQLAADALVLPLDAYVPAAVQQRLLAQALAGARVAGADGQARLYGLPISVDTMALYYNRANFSEPPPDTDTMFSIARALSEPDANPPRWGMAYNLSLDATAGYLYAFGGRVFDEQGTLVLGTTGRSGTEQWLTWLLTLSRDQQLLAVADSVQVSQNVAASQALMTIDWAHNITTYQQLWGEQLGVAPLPPLSGNNAVPTPYVTAEVAVVNVRASARERDAALEFAQFLLRTAAQQELWKTGRLPALNAIEGAADAWPGYDQLLALHGQAQAGIPALNDPRALTVERVLRQMQRDVLRGLATPSDAVSQAVVSLERELPLPAAPRND